MLRQPGEPQIRGQRNWPGRPLEILYTIEMVLLITEEQKTVVRRNNGARTEPRRHGSWAAAMTPGPRRCCEFLLLGNLRFLVALLCILICLLRLVSF